MTRIQALKSIKRVEKQLETVNTLLSLFRHKPFFDDFIYFIYPLSFKNLKVNLKSIQHDLELTIVALKKDTL